MYFAEIVLYLGNLFTPHSALRQLSEYLKEDGRRSIVDLLSYAPVPTLPEQ